MRMIRSWNLELEEVKGVVTILLFILLHPRVNDAFSKGEEEARFQLGLLSISDGDGDGEGMEMHKNGNRKSHLQSLSISISDRDGNGDAKWGWG